MRRTLVIVSAIATLAAAAATGNAHAVVAPVTIGGFVFDANAAADGVTIVPGADPTFYLCGATSDNGAPTLPGLTAAQSANRVITDGIADAEMFGRAVVDVAFVDNVVVNGAAPDLVVFESGLPEAFAVSVFDAHAHVLSAAHTRTCSYRIPRRLWIPAQRGPNRPGCCAGADLMDVLALNSGAPASEPLGLPAASFESNSGADVASVVPGSAPTFSLCGVTPEAGEPTLPGLTPDQSATLVVSDGSADDEVFGKAVLDVGFTDNVTVNGTGPDVAVFESGRPEAFSVSVFDPVAHAFTAPRIYEPAPTGSYDRCGFPVNVAQIDLSAFGIARLGAVSLLRIDNLGAAGSFDGADIADVRALHSAVPLSLSVRGTLNLKSKGLLSVALLSTATFNTLSVDSTTVMLGDPDATGTAGPVSVATEDVNGDGRLDLLLAFSIPDLLKAGALASTTDRVVVSGQTFDSRSVLGSASVRIVP